jgi:hypothetical protein
MMASRSDITVGLTPTKRWNLVWERGSEVIAELLLLLFFVILLVVRPLRSLVGDHEITLLCLVQEDSASLAAPISTASMITPVISRIPAISTVSKTPVLTPAPAPISEKKSSRTIPIVSLNPLRIVPSKPRPTSIQQLSQAKPIV